MRILSGCLGILVLGLFFSNSNAVPSFSVEVADGDIRFDFYNTMEPEDCFISPCHQDLNTQFFLKGIFDDETDPCEFASVMQDIAVSEPFLEAVNSTYINVGVAPFFKIVFGTNRCRRDLTTFAEEVSEIFDSTDFTKVIISVIESSESFNFDELTCNIPCTEEEKSVRINFVIPSFCGSTCAAEADCQIRDTGLEKWQLDKAIADFELHDLLHNWNSYLEILEEELNYLESNLDNEDSDVDWKSVLDFHTKANDCLIGGIEGVSNEEDRYGSLMWALDQINSMK